MVTTKRRDLFSKYGLASVGRNATVRYKDNGAWKNLLKKGFQNADNIGVVVGMLFVAASLNDVDASTISEIASDAQDVAYAQDGGEQSVATVVVSLHPKSPTNLHLKITHL